MKKQILSKLEEAVFSILPISIIILLLSFTPLFSLTGNEIAAFLVTTVMLIIGIALFNLGADIAMTPMGKTIGTGLTKSGKLLWLVLICFFLGLFITIAEPDLQVLATQVSQITNKTLLIVVVGLGVAVFLVFAVLKVIFKMPISSLLMFMYLVLFGFTALVVIFGKEIYIPLCYDSGGVTTGPITVPFIMALGSGIATTIGQKTAKEDSFGFVAFCSIGSVLAVVVLTFFFKDGGISGIGDYDNLDGWGLKLLSDTLKMMKEVGIPLLLISGFYLIINAIFLKQPKKQLYKLFIGILYTFVGLVIFLTAANVGYMPIGNEIGKQVAEKSKVILVVLGLVLGAVTVLAEPAIHVLNKQVEEITNGLVTKKSMLIALTFGVGASIALSMIRIIFNFNIMFYLVPGYLISLGLSLFVPSLYTAIAFDSGGVASGPLTSCFILPFAIGACSMMTGGSDATYLLSNAFGVVSMVAMTPLISIQLLGFTSIVSKKIKRKRVVNKMLTQDDFQIIEFME